MRVGSQCVDCVAPLVRARLEQKGIDGSFADWCVQTDQKYAGVVGDSGSTCTAVEIRPPLVDAKTTACTWSVNVSQLGDSAAVLFRPSMNYEVAFSTVVHHPLDPEEQKRIVNANGKVRAGQLLSEKGSISLSRAFGDVSFKAQSALPATKQLVHSTLCLSFCQRSSNPLFCDRSWRSQW
jgi:serine/threonine protein phosphatase PrpC